MAKKEPTQGTRIYGASDDLIEFEGDVTGEVGAYGVEESEPSGIFCSDGTVLFAWYGEDGIWHLRLKHKGSLFIGIEQCSDSDADPHSDVATFKPGLTGCWHGKECSVVN